jgi:hypothetical protein
MELIPLNLPSYPFKIIEREGKFYIFDLLRKKELLLTPEEWVRQHFVQFLIHQKGYSKNHISLEKGLQLNDLKKRTDILVYNLDAVPIMLIECKAPNVKITQDVFDQAARYNMIYKVKYLVVTNGLDHFFCEMDYECESYRFIEEIPENN